MSNGLNVLANYTWSKTTIYNFNQWTNTQLGKNVANRPHAMNFNFGYEIPNANRFWNNRVARAITAEAGCGSHAEPAMQTHPGRLWSGCAMGACVSYAPVIKHGSQ